MATAPASATVASARPSESRLRDFPVAFFVVVMGYAGLTLAWKRAEVVFQPWFAVSCWLEALGALAFVAVAVTYLQKFAAHPDAVLAELRHPVKLSFFPTISIGLILLATASIDRYFLAAQVLWVVGTTAHLAFTVYVVNAWLHRTHFEPAHLNPAWFIPAVGNVLVPIAGVRFGHPELSWFFFATGLLFWIVLLTLVMHRLFFLPALPERLQPTLFILAAPPAAAFLGYVALTGTVDAFARLLYYAALAFTLLLAARAPRLLRARFFLSSWAYAFPLAAVTAATLVMAQRTREAALEWLGAGLLAAVSLLVVALTLRTAAAVARREICVAEG
jgi:tellurite resistance protein